MKPRTGRAAEQIMDARIELRSNHGFAANKGRVMRSEERPWWLYVAEIAFGAVAAAILFLAAMSFSNHRSTITIVVLVLALLTVLIAIILWFRDRRGGWWFFLFDCVSFLDWW